MTNPNCHSGGHHFSQTNNARRKRRAYSLIELLVVVGLSSFVLMTVAVTLHLLQRVNIQIRTELPRSEALSRLTMRLRTDAHDSTGFDQQKNANGNTVGRFIQTDGDEISYEQQSSVIVRKVVRNGQQVHQDKFRCADQAETAWSIASDSSVVTLLIQKHRVRSPAGDDSLVVDRIDAALGLSAGVRQ